MRMLRHPSAWVLALVAVAVLALGACGGRKPTPPLSAVVDAPLLRPGSSWTYKVTESTRPAPDMVTLTFQKDDVYKGSGVLAFAAGPETVFYDRDLNFVAVIRDGKVLREASPSFRALDFPSTSARSGWPSSRSRTTSGRSPGSRWRSAGRCRSTTW
jgi:hypothetical protein